MSIKDSDILEFLSGNGVVHQTVDAIADALGISDFLGKKRLRGVLHTLRVKSVVVSPRGGQDLYTLSTRERIKRGLIR